MPATALPDPAICEQARLSRDARFDGLFFTAVSSTGIYCRPTCPAPAPRPHNVRYYPNAAAAEAAGFRPCLRCRPELSPSAGGWRRGDDALARALKLIDEGFLADASLADLAGRVHVGERQLRRLFADRLGAPPIGVHGTRRLLFAKQLLTETALPITEVALAAGFGSLRRFNTCFHEAYGMAPSALRQRPAAAAGQVLTLRLNYRPPYDFVAMLEFLRGRALPGVEHVDATAYRRVIGDAAAPAWLQVAPWPRGAGSDGHALELQLHGCPPARLQAVVERVRRMFDLDADPQAIAGVLGADAGLRPLLRKRPGLRLPSAWDGFEVAVRAVVGQQVSVGAARTITARIVQRHGTALPALTGAPELERLFPTPERLAEGDLDGLGLTTTRAATVRAIARALLDGRVDFDPARTLDDMVARWTALPGIGPWTAQYIAMRGLGHPDAFPAGDLVLQKQLAGDDDANLRLRTLNLTRRAEAWRPWRAYAVIHAWREAALAQPPVAADRSTTIRRSKP
ncbi:AlkA N-terminal domain-containing protein [Luteimonas composti]|uniref:DNA-3-methyladenine glycosylase II n=1 Tax=Luteimonas composti TaxID=398257 RepID=A0ABT6MLH6_9GAMM|nr:DNA-3-methyladenine glycosylase 2 [Luteimonas composti]MDH7451505.1 AlkA N-terminal domain-containing protein [Luteimonas composti]